MKNMNSRANETWGEQIFVQFHCLSSYQNDLWKWEMIVAVNAIYAIA